MYICCNEIYGITCEVDGGHQSIYGSSCLCMWAEDSEPKCSRLCEDRLPLTKLYQSSHNLTSTDSSLFVSNDCPRTSDKPPSWNSGSCMELSISVSECSQVPVRHREMGTALDHRAGQSAHTTHSWSIYHGPLVWSCFAGSTTLPFIHPAALRVFDHTNVQGILLSSLGSSSANSLGLCRLVMTTDRARHAGLIVLIRWGILGNAVLRLIDLFCVRYQSWHQPHIATLRMSGWWNSWTTRLLSFNWQNRWNHIIYN